MMTDGIYALTLRAKDGRERRDLWWLPDENWQRNMYEKAHKLGLEVIENEI